jgi:hypothetical protein
VLLYPPEQPQQEQRLVRIPLPAASGCHAQ